MRTVEPIRIAIGRHWSLAWPLIIANAATPFLGLADAAIAGHLDSAYYLAAVTVGAELFAVFFGAFNFLRMGTTGLVAQATGAQTPEIGLETLGNGLLLGLVIGLCLIGIGWAGIPTALALADPAADLVDPLRGYLEIRIYGAPASLMLFAVSGWLIGLGRTREALYLAVGINAVNILLNFLLAIGFGLNAKGIALGTVIAEVLGILYGFYWVKTLHPQASIIRLYKPISERMLQLLKLNGPLFLRTLALQTVFVTLSVYAARIGVTEAAAVGLFLVLLATAAYALDGFAFASEIEAGRQLGAGQVREFVHGLWAGAILTVFCALCIIGVISLFGGSLVELLTEHTGVQSESQRLLQWFGLILAALCLSYWLDGVFVGLTRSVDMCISMAVATGLGWFGVLQLVSTDRVEGLFIAFFSFGVVRTLTLGSRLPAALRDLRSRAANHPIKYEPV